MTADDDRILTGKPKKRPKEFHVIDHGDRFTIDDVKRTQRRMRKQYPLTTATTERERTTHDSL